MRRISFFFCIRESPKPIFEIIDIKPIERVTIAKTPKSLGTKILAKKIFKIKLVKEETIFENPNQIDELNTFSLRFKLLENYIYKVNTS